MQHHTATLHCPNPNCQAPNPESHKFCGKCGTFLPKRYLIAAAADLETRAPGTLVGDRYWLKEQGILLDTHPDRLPETPEEVPESIVPYLNLFPYRMHVPQAYGCIGDGDGAIWLLENAPLDKSQPEEIKLHQSAIDLWQSASPFRQLNWLWQIAQLWEPFQQLGVAGSLLDPSLLRAEGNLIRLLRLKPDRALVNLTQLGELWSQWVEITQPPLKNFLERLSRLLTSGQVQTSEQLLTLLDRGLNVVGQAYGRHVRVATLSDRGPSRSRNEDACYPKSEPLLWRSSAMGWGDTKAAMLPPNSRSQRSSST
jgi:protein phosphatase